MYCSSCGTQVTQGLSYCNRCGANLRPNESLTPGNKPAKLAGLAVLGVSAMFALPLAGVAMVFALSMDMKRVADFPLDHVMILAVFGLFIELVGVLMLGRLVSPIIKAYLHSDAAVPESKKPELVERPPARLEEARESASSVTENTTRAFEPLYREQKSR